MKKTNILLLADVQTLFHLSEVVNLADSLRLFVNFFHELEQLLLFHFSGTISVSKHRLKTISGGLHIDGSHIFNIRMVILS